MGTFAKTAIVDYCLSFAYQGKQTSVSVYVCLLQTNGSFPFPFSVCNKQLELLFSISSISLFICSRFKWKAEAQVIFPIYAPFAHCANGSLSFVRWLTKKNKWKLSVCKWTKLTKWTFLSMLKRLSSNNQGGGVKHSNYTFIDLFRLKLPFQT
jgi:hypothetical protein